MENYWKNFTVNFDYINLESIIDNWEWLIGSKKKVILISSLGDLFFSDVFGHCYWLNVGTAFLERVANDYEDFQNQLQDEENINEWFLPDLIEKIKASGLELSENKLFGYKTLPILGGEYLPENFHVIDIEVHFELSGIILKQIKDLPDGTKVEIKVVD